MESCIGVINGKPVVLKLENGVVSLDGEALPIKNLDENELARFNEEVAGLPRSDEPGYNALASACRCAFLASLLGRAVGDECVDALTRVLDHEHCEVLKYLGDQEDQARP